MVVKVACFNHFPRPSVSPCFSLSLVVEIKVLVRVVATSANL